MFKLTHDSYLGEIMVDCPTCGETYYIFAEDPVYTICDNCLNIFDPVPKKLLTDIKYRIEYHTSKGKSNAKKGSWKRKVHTSRNIPA